jgi:hypothetical protein
METSITQNRMDYKRTIIGIRGDTQGGHSGGLLNPDTLLPDMEIDEEGNVVTGWRHVELRPIQKRLWQWHSQDLEDIKKLASGDPIVWLEMGDLTQGNVFRDDLSIVSMSEQWHVSRFNTMPLLELPNVKAMYVTRGTGVHVWGEGSTETMLVTQLRREYPKINIAITSHWLLDLDGFTLDIAHHGPGAGIRNWTRGNAFELYAKSVMLDDIDVRQTHPSALVRAHRHEFIYRRPIHQVKNRVWEMPSFISPPYCFIGDHAQKVMNSPSWMGVGMLALEVINGKLHDWHPFTHFVDLRAREVVS